MHRLRSTHDLGRGRPEHSSGVCGMTTECTEDDTLAALRAAVQLEKAQRAQGLAVKAARAREGRPIPCIDSRSDLWLSERVDQRCWAVKLCQACPVIAFCEAVAAAEMAPRGECARPGTTARRLPKPTPKTIRTRGRSAGGRARSCTKGGT